MKIAIVHDWLVNYAGSERVIEQLLICFPDADLFSLVDFLPQDQRGFIKNKPVKTSFIQNLPFAKKHFRKYLPLMPLAIEQLNVRDYDIVISSSHCVAKGVIVAPDQLHLSYVYSPMRYAWDLQFQYLQEMNLNKGIKGLYTKWILHKLRMWDASTANRVDHFATLSKYIARRINKTYRRESDIIAPPVSTDDFELSEERKDFYLAASRLVPYKKLDLIVDAFAKMPHKKLVVIGDGPEMPKIKAKAEGKANIAILGHQPFSVLKKHMQQAKAFIYAAEDDFSIVAIEAQACGTPVIAFGKGALTEIIPVEKQKNKTGLFYYEQTTDALINAIDSFESSDDVLPGQHCRDNALRYSANIFRDKFKAFVETKWEAFQKNNSSEESTC